jgi:Zn-dependent protease
VSGPEAPDEGPYRYGPRGEREVVRRGWGPAPRNAGPAPPDTSEQTPADTSEKPPPPPPPETGTYIPPGATAPGHDGAPYGYEGRPPPPPPRSGRTVAPQRSPWVLPLVIAAIALLVVLVHNHRISTNDVVLFCCLIPSIILHEISHGWVALAFGDDTAKRAGRLTLNPLPHIDPIGTIVVPAIMAMSGYGAFGWAKPVPVNVGRLRSPRNQSVLVALAGPATNLVLMGIAAVVIRTQLHHLSFDVFRVFYFLGLANLWLAAFNLIPIPPLDGSAVVERMIPMRWWPGYLRIRQFTLPLVLVLVVLNAQLGVHGPISILFQHIEGWWNSLIGQ